MPIKIGIAGVRGLSVADALKGSEEAVVTAFCDLNEELLKSQSEKYSVPKTYRVF